MSGPGNAKPAPAGTVGISAAPATMRPAFSDRGALSVNDFCQWAGIGRSTIYKEVSDGKLALRRLGRKSVVTVTEANRWLDSLPIAAGNSVKPLADTLGSTANISGAA